jgi:hypothetical protein
MAGNARFRNPRHRVQTITDNFLQSHRDDVIGIGTRTFVIENVRLK